MSIALLRCLLQTLCIFVQLSWVQSSPGRGLQPFTVKGYDTSSLPNSIHSSQATGRYNEPKPTQNKWNPSTVYVYTMGNHQWIAHILQCRQFLFMLRASSFLSSQWIRESPNFRQEICSSCLKKWFFEVWSYWWLGVASIKPTHRNT